MATIQRVGIHLVLFSLICLTGCATFPGTQSKQAVPTVLPDLSWFRAARLGMFVHWDPVSQVGTEISWSRISSAHQHGTIPTVLYDNLYRYFNPTRFDADAFVQTAKAMGARYLVFTTKHHDGFSMFDSRWTDYKITHTPFRRDITAEIAEACHRSGIKLGFYYSPPDWHHPDFRTENHDRYKLYLHRQVRELCTRYGRVDVFWFDGLNCTADDWDADRLIAMIRELQPGIVINNRAGLPADYDTPEQRVGTFQNNRPWESCITIGDQWSYKPHDNVKTTDQLVRTIVQCACGDGNLLLNVGPKWTGEIEPLQVQRLKELGDWLGKYGESVYATHGGPFAVFPWGGSTHRGNRIYLHIWDWDSKRITLPRIAAQITKCSVLTGGQAKVITTEPELEIELAGLPGNGVTTVTLDLDASTDRIEPIVPVTFDKKVTASNEIKQGKQFDADKAVDGSVNTRWATSAGTKSAWLEVDLGKEQRFGSVWLSEEYDRVQEFELQMHRDGEWHTFSTGHTIGKRLLLNFTPVSAQRVRLNITKASEGPSIREFQLYPAK